MRGHEIIITGFSNGRSIDFADIKSVELKDNYGTRGSHVQITTLDDNVHNISKYTKVDTYTLYLALRKAVEEYQSNTNQEA